MVATATPDRQRNSVTDATIAASLVQTVNLLRRDAVPSDFYQPHSIVRRSPVAPADAAYDRKGKASGQLQFHRSTHPARIIASGNGWGGTTCMAAEVDAWMRHTNRWQKTPDGPIQAIWFCPIFQQFAMLRQQLTETAFGNIPKWFSSGEHRGFRWPDGSHLYLGSYDTSWGAYQGIQPHLVVFDEQPPPALWREMRQRRRSAKRLTKFICKATQTMGWSWMAEEIYLPWLKLHAQHGMGEEQALLAQLHEFFWVWSKGGVHDNPDVPQHILVEKENEIWPSKRERKVRLYGGFERWSGHCVFEEDALEWQRRRCAEIAAERGHGGWTGSFVLKPKKEAA